MAELKTCWIDDRFEYDGRQLHSLFAYLEYGIQGDSVIAWRGPCNIPLDHMVDGEDKVEQAEICGSDMIHFVFEIFGRGLDYAVSFQRLFACIVRESLANSLNQAVIITRDGDDLFIDSGKLSISIATVSPVSCMIHFAVNVSNDGTPVKTSCLSDLGIDEGEFVKDCFDRVSVEFKSVIEATKKVHWVR